MYETRGANRVATGLAQSIAWRASAKDKCYSQRPKKGMASKTYRCQEDGETLLVERGPLLDSKEVQGFLTREHTRGTVEH